MEFSIDFGNVAPPVAADAPRYASVAGTLFPLGNEECVFRTRADGQSHVMTEAVFEAMRLCQTFKTLDEHARVVAQQIPQLQGRVAVAHQALQDLAGRGLLVEADAYLRALQQGASRAPAPMRALWVRGATDAEQLEGLLRDWTDAPKLPLALLDGGPESTVAAHARLLARHAQEHAIPVVHWHAQARARLVAAMRKAVPQAQAAIDYFLAPGPQAGTGTLDNWSRLLSAGCRLLHLDVHQRPPLRRLSGGQPGLNLSGRVPTLVTFYDDAQAAAQAGEACSGSEWDAVLNACGQGMVGVAAQEPWRPVAQGLEHVVPADGQSFTAATRIRAVCVGSCGTPEWFGTESLYLLEGAAREEFWRERGKYLRHLQQPYLATGMAQACLLRQARAAPVALDAGTLLPPTLPGGLDGDLLFGALMHAIDPDGAVLHAAWCLPTTAPLSPRPGGAQALTPSLAQFVAEYLAPRIGEVRAADPGQRLQTVAALLSDLALAPRAALRELVSEYLCFKRSEFIARLQNAFAQAERAPVHWQADVREWITVNGRALTGAQAPRLRDWPAEGDAERATDHLAHALAAFAQGLQQWPLLWQAAQEQGERWFQHGAR